MAQDDYFSFGDEELEGELEVTDLGQDPPEQAVALVEPPNADEFGADADWYGSPREHAAPPREDSKDRSSERRLHSLRWTRILAALTLGLLAIFLGRTAISTLDGGEPAVQNAATTTARSAPSSTAALGARQRTQAIRASRERAAERQRARQHRAQTRRRARRSRQRKVAERRESSKGRRAQTEAQEEASAAAEIPAPDYVAPTYEPAPSPSPPATEPAPEPPSEPHIQNGANSPEFGL